MAKIINIFSGPGTGKSTVAAELFVFLKKKGELVDMVRELATDLVREESFKSLKDLPYMLSVQNHRVKVLADKVDYVVVDSPILLPSAYSRVLGGQSSALDDFSLHLFNEYENVNFFLRRNDDWYSNDGRYQSLEVAKELDEAIYKFLKDNSVEFFDVKTPEELLDIFKSI